MRQQDIDRLEAAPTVIKEQFKRHISCLENEIKELKKTINQYIDDYPDLKSKKELLNSIPGIGEATINVVLSEFSDLTQFKNAKALSAYIGVAPRIRRSGTSLRERGMMSKMGRNALRKAFYMPALVALRYNPSIVEMNKRLTAAGKSMMTIVGAAMRKLVHLIYGVLKNGVPYSASYAWQRRRYLTPFAQWRFSPDGMGNLDADTIRAVEEEIRNMIINEIKNPGVIRSDVISALKIVDEVDVDADEILDGMIATNGELSEALKKMIKIEPYAKTIEQLP